MADELLRIATAGSVDDGKSTLIGRLLHDTKSIFEDQLESIERTSEKRGDEQTDLALLTDGLRAEREQGITIDVAYRYFATPKRKFVIADTPGHIQYTRNMVTGASTANLALLLIDARKGVLEQTRRHALLSSMLGVPHLVLCVNKMDLVDYDQRIYDEIREEFTTFAAKLDITDLSFVPISALAGDNVVEPLDQHALVPRAAAARPPRGRPHRLRPQPGRQPLPGPVRDPAAVGRVPRLPRLRRLGRRRHLQAGRRGDGDAVAQNLEDRLDRHPRRAGRPGLPADGGDAAARGRRRRLARRPDLPPVQPADDEPSLRRADLLVRRHLAPAHRHPVPAEAHDPLGRGRDREAALPARRRHPARRPRGGDARGQRDRPRLDPDRLAALLRHLPAEPHDRQLHPRRPRHRPHRRGGDDHRRRRRRLGRHRRRRNDPAGRREHHLPPEQALPRGALRRRWRRRARRSG